MSQFFSPRYARRIEPVRVRETTSPFGRPRGSTPAQRAGLAFERAVGRWLTRAGIKARSVWLEYEEESGVRALASPDFVITDGPLAPAILECKLTFRSEAIAQLENLYLPLCEHLWGQQGCWKRLVVVKRWHASAESHLQISGLEEALPGVSVLFRP